MTGLTVVIILAAVMGVMKTAIYWLSMQWWKQTIGPVQPAATTGM